MGSRDLSIDDLWDIAGFSPNPEGFVGVMITVIANALADHIVERIEFMVGNERMGYNLEWLFPATKTFPQKELVDAGGYGLYDRARVDSWVEDRFVEQRLKDDEKVICYFKFPPAFRIQFPKIIGKYNPDWGILRYDEDGEVVLQLVRETKGTVEMGQLQNPHERRNVCVAMKHFRELGIGYRVVTDKTVDWWQSEEGVPGEAVGGDSKRSIMMEGLPG